MRNAVGLNAPSHHPDLAHVDLGLRRRVHRLDPTRRSQDLPGDLPAPCMRWDALDLQSHTLVQSRHLRADKPSPAAEAEGGGTDGESPRPQGRLHRPQSRENHQETLGGKLPDDKAIISSPLEPQNCRPCRLQASAMASPGSQSEQGKPQTRLLGIHLRVPRDEQGLLLRPQRGVAERERGVLIQGGQRSAHVPRWIRRRTARRRTEV